MKVLLVGDTVGGVFTYVCELAAALAELDVETHVALLGRRLSLDQRRALRDSRARRVWAADYALEWMPEPWRDVERSGAWLLEIAERVRPDVVHLNGFAHAALPWRQPVLVAGHSCVVSWWEAVHGCAPPPEWDRYREAVERGLRAAQLVVAPTSALLDSLIRHYRPPGETLVIPNGRRAARLVRPKEPFVLAVGRLWDEAKNLVALDRAAARIDWPVLVAGDEPAAHARPTRARLLGPLPAATLADHFARAAIFAAPARYEPFGLAALEAAQAGCALVLGDIESLREVWGDAALYVDPADPDELAAALRRVAGDDRLRAQLADAAAARAAEYTPGRMAAAYLDAYERLVTASFDGLADFGGVEVRA